VIFDRFSLLEIFVCSRNCQALGVLVFIIKGSLNKRIMGPTKEKILALEMRMSALGIEKKDIEEKFIKSSGRGGQKVNKSSSAVFLRHKKSNLSVKCGKARSQHLNRFLALRNLVDKIEANMTGKDKKEQEKIRKQKQRRKRRTQKKLSMS
jgi:protein subunit release factor B